MIIIVIEFMFLGINIFWALLRAHFNPRLTARAKMSVSRAQNIFMPKNINSVVLLSSQLRWPFAQNSVHFYSSKCHLVIIFTRLGLPNLNFVDLAAFSE